MRARTILYIYMLLPESVLRQCRLLCLWLVLLCAVPSYAQNSKKVQALKAQKTELQKTLNKAKADLDQTKQKVRTGQQSLSFLDMQMDTRLNYIRQLESEMNSLEGEIGKLQERIKSGEKELRAKREKLKQAVRYARTRRTQNSPLIFILSSGNVTQMYRRARYAREYALYQYQLTEQIVGKQVELLKDENRLLASKSEMNDLLREVMSQRKQLNTQQIREQKRVEGLKQQESGLADKVAQQQKQLTALNKKIDDLIAYEIEQARKRAEEAARKKAAEEAARKKKSTGKTSSKGTSSSKTSTKPAKSEKADGGKQSGWLTAAERQLNGSFEQNKGRLPVPITGQYMIGNRFGVYNVKGLKNVQLDNKGTNYVGHPGARARAVFDGEVTAVFQFDGTKNILVRHGSYISVYCNLSSVIVTKGQKVKARDVLGTVATDADGNCVLHFQLRKETAKLNPEAWIGR